MSLETQLREALASRADALDAPAFDPYERVAGAVVTHRRRRRVAAAGAVATVTAVALLVPGLVDGGRDATLPAKRTQVVVPGPDDPRWRSYSTWPTRGSLATDTTFLDEVGTRFGATHILFAADLDRSRVVVDWTSDTSDSSAGLTMYSGPRGATVDELRRVSQAQVEDGVPVTLRENSDNDSRLVVLTTPGNPSIAISRDIRISLDGTTAREGFGQVRTTDGMYSTVLQDSPPLLTRIMDHRGTVASVLLVGPPTRPRDTQGSICFSCTGQEFLTKAETSMSEAVATTLGIDAADVTTTTRYFGPVDPEVAGRSGFTDASSGQVSFRLMVGDTTLPGGQVLRSALVLVTAKDGGFAESHEMLSGVPIAAATAAQRPFVIKGLDPDTGRMSYQVFAPGAATAQMVSEAPSIYPASDRVVLRSDSAVLGTPMPAEGSAPYEVVTYDGAGAQIGRWPVETPAATTWAEGGP